MAAPSSKPVFGKTLASEFLFASSYRNLNNGSFGAIPRVIQERQRHYQSLAESRPDPFIRYDYPKLLDQSRAAVAGLLNAPVDNVVFVPNASVGVNTVLQNLIWNPDKRDEIISFSTIYGGCGKSIDFIVESRAGLVSSRTIEAIYPLEDDVILSRFEAAIQASKAAGKRPRVAIFDVVSSMPGVCVPYKQLTAACRAHGILSLIDGAQGIGLVPLDLSATDPDFFVSNCHKWLHVPRGCAVFYVPERNQGLVRSTLPTSHGFIPKPVAGGKKHINPLPPSTKSVFVNNFEFNGTLDNAPYLCVADAIKWRREVLGGEEAIMKRNTALAKEGGKKVAEILGTEVIENGKGTLGQCAMVNVGLPLWLEKDKAPQGACVVAMDRAVGVTQGIQQALMKEFDTFLPIFVHGGRWWARLSAQVSLELSDFEEAGQALRKICDGIVKQEASLQAKL